MRKIIVMAEHSEGIVKPVTWQLVEFGAQLSRMIESEVEVVIISGAPETCARDISERTGLPVSAVHVPELNRYNGQVYKQVMKSLVETDEPAYICIGHTANGLDVAPGLSAALCGACITSVNGLFEDENGPLFSRALFNGKVNATIRSESETTVLTIQQGCFLHKVYTGPAGQITRLSMEIESRDIGHIETITAKDNSPSLAEANVIVAAGRGIKEEENLAFVRQIADRIPGAVVAGSRPLIDSGWMENKYQVGITGAIVTPDVYIAIGISGSSQHIAGMSGSAFVVSINNDANAAIFNNSDVCIVEDAVKFIETLLKCDQNPPPDNDCSCFPP